MDKWKQVARTALESLFDTRPGSEVDEYIGAVTEALLQCEVDTILRCAEIATAERFTDEQLAESSGAEHRSFRGGVNVACNAIADNILSLLPKELGHD